MDREEALKILGVSELSNFDSFRLDISRNWKKLLIKYQGKNDKKLSRVNRAYDLLKRISNDEFDKIFDEENLEKDIFNEENNEDYFLKEKNSSKVTFGFDTDENEVNKEDYFLEEKNSDTNDMQFNLSNTYIFEPEPDAKLKLVRKVAAVTASIFGISVSVSKEGIEWDLGNELYFFSYELIKNIVKTKYAVRLDLFKRYKFRKKHFVTCYGNNDELYECINFFYLNYKNDFNSKYHED